MDDDDVDGRPCFPAPPAVAVIPDGLGEEVIPTRELTLRPDGRPELAGAMPPVLAGFKSEGIPRPDGRLELVISPSMLAGFKSEGILGPDGRLEPAVVPPPMPVVSYVGC